MASLFATVLRVGPSIAVVCGIIFFRALTFVTCTLWLRQSVSPARAALGALLFVSLPFSMTANPIVRVGFAEVAATAFIPLVLLFVEPGSVRAPKRVAALSVVYAALAVTHIPQLILVFLLACVYVFVVARWRGVILNAVAFSLGCALSAPSLLPALLTRRNISADAWTNNPYVAVYNNFLFSIARFRLYRLCLLDVLLYATWFLCAGVLVANWRSDKLTRVPALRASAVVLVLGLLGMTPLAHPVWTRVGLLQAMQFPWRTFPIVLACTSLLASHLVSARSRRPALLGIAGLIVLQLAATYVGAYRSLCAQPRQRSDHASSWLPVFVPFGARDTQQIADVQSTVPEYIPAEAAQAGWHVSEQREGVVFKTQGPRPFTPQQGLTIHPVRYDAISISHTSSQPQVVLLPEFYYPDEQTNTALQVEPDARTGLARLELPAGTTTLLVTHTRPVHGMVAGYLLSALSALVLLIAGTSFGDRFSRLLPASDTDEPLSPS